VRGVPMEGEQAEDRHAGRGVRGHSFLQRSG
jgi:hypothetical protein